MTQPIESSEPYKTNGLLRSPTPEEVRAQLGRILKSPIFQRSQRLQRFLTFVTEQTLAGKASEIKEYSLGRQVFDRGEHYDPSGDSIVRVEARRLRNKLHEYYEHQGAEDPVRIAVNPGTYAPVLEYRSPSSPAERTQAALETPSLDSRAVAVLPFVNMSPDPGQDFFCDGITEELLNTLAAIPELRVVARTSVFFFKGKNVDVRQIGQQLGVGTIVEGSVRKAGDLLRITAQAVDAANGVHLWSNTFERKLIDVFSVQDEIAKAVADALRVSLVTKGEDSAHPHNLPQLEAYIYFLKGRHLWNDVSEEGVNGALQQYQQAILTAPDYAPPYAGLSIALSKLTFWSVLPPKEGLQKAKQAAMEALRLNPRLAGAHAALGLLISLGEWERDNAMTLFRDALELEPSSVIAHNALAVHHLCRGEFEQVRAILKRFAELDPISPFNLRSQGCFHYFSRNYNQAIKDFEAALSIDPRFREVQFFLGYAYMRIGRTEAAAEVLSELPDGEVYRAIKWAALGEVFGMAGDKTGAQKALAELDTLARTTYVSPISRLSIYAGLGEWSAVFEELERAYEEHSAWLNLTKIDPRYDPIRNDRRFVDLLTRIHLA